MINCMLTIHDNNLLRIVDRIYNLITMDEYKKFLSDLILI